MTPEMYWVPGPWRGLLAVVSRPRGGDWLADELRETGIGTVVSLLETEEAADLGLAGEGEAAAQSGLGFVSFPVPDQGVPASALSTVLLAAELEDALDGGKNVAIHCRQSVGRAGLIASAVLAVSGLDPSRAMEIVSAARGQEVPETAEQRQWLLNLPAGVSP